MSGSINRIVILEYAKQLLVLVLLSFQSGCKSFIVTLLTGSDMSVMNSGPKRKDYSDHSSYSYPGIGPQNAP